MRILDLGCGSGRDLAYRGVTASDEVTGLDIDPLSLAEARKRFSLRTYLQGAAEYMPFEDENFERVISNVALPYMNIPKLWRKFIASWFVAASVPELAFAGFHNRRTSPQRLPETNPHAFSAIRHDKRVIVPLRRQNCPVRPGQNGIVSDGARNEDRSEARGFRQ